MSQTTTYLPPAQRPTSLIVVGGSTFYQGGYGGPPTNYPTPKANSGSDFDNAYERQRNIISTGQKVGIGIGVTFAVLFIISAIVTCCMISRVRNKRRQRIEAEKKAYRERTSMETATTARPSYQPGMDNSDVYYAPNSYNNQAHGNVADANPYSGYSSQQVTGGGFTHSGGNGLDAPSQPAPAYQPSTYNAGHSAGTGGANNV